MKSEIFIHQGFGDLTLNTDIMAAKAILGNPDETKTDNMNDESETTILTYCEHNVSLYFAGKNQHLDCIEVFDEKTTLLGFNPFELSPNELIKAMKEKGYIDVEKEKQEWGETLIAFGDANLDFFYDNEELVSILIGQ